MKGAPRGFERALVAVDGSEHAEAAAAFLARLPLDRAVAVRLFGVVEPPRYPSTVPGVAARMLRQAIAGIVKERRAALGQALIRTAAMFKGRASTIASRIVVDGPAHEIVQAAADPRVGLVVVGARGLGTLKRLLLGSVSEFVLRHADRPVLIVKGEPR